MKLSIIIGLLIPFAGTVMGSMIVLFMKNQIKHSVRNILTGFAAGVMVCASFWSLLLPAVEQQEANSGKVAVLLPVAGFCMGMLFLLLIDIVTPHMHFDESVEGPRTNLKKTTMLVLAVVIHNIPEGMAVGVLYAGYLQNKELITMSAAFSLAIGIAVQNFPEGAIVSMPLHANGMSKYKACFQGILSGVVEPVAGLVTIAMSSVIVPYMPCLLSFAAGAMMYVVVEELIPEMSQEKHSNKATISFMGGFAVMMILDIILG